MKTTLIALLLITASIPLFAQKKPKVQDSTTAPTTQKSSTAPVSKQALRLPRRDKLEGFERTLLDFINSKGKTEEYSILYDFFYQSMRESTINQEKASLLSNTNLKSKLEKQNDFGWEATITHLLLRLIGSGFTLEKIQQLSQQGLNIFDIIENQRDAIISNVILSNLVVIGTIDSIYNDESMYDAHRSSFVINVNETLKGDNKIKKIIIRQPGHTIDGQYIPGGSDGIVFSPEIKSKYLIFADKFYYEFYIQNPSGLYFDEMPIIKNDAESLAKRKDCYHINLQSILISPDEYPSRIDYQSNRQEKIQRVRAFCKQFGRLLP